MNALSELKRIAAMLVVLACAPAWASGPTDLWWKADESGWGVNVVGQGDTLFMTLFVYDQNGQPLWLVAPATKKQGTSSAGVTYTGPLYQTSGPWLGAGTFNPGAVNAVQVGTATFLHITQRTASLTYTVNGVQVSKPLTRQTWNNNPFVAGSYLGAMVLNRSGCSVGPSYAEIPMQFTIAITGSSAQMTMQPTGGGLCSVSGTYSQDGSQGRIEGSGASCVTGTGASVVVSAIDASDDIYGRITFTSGGCTESGTFAGAFRGQ